MLLRGFVTLDAIARVKEHTFGAEVNYWLRKNQFKNIFLAASTIYKKMTIKGGIDLKSPAIKFSCKGKINDT